MCCAMLGSYTVCRMFCSFYRALWHYYFENNDGIVFVIDSCDHDRFEEAQEELQSMLSDDRLRDSAVLVLANKQDVDVAKAPAQLVVALGLDKMGEKRNRRKDNVMLSV